MTCETVYTLSATALLNAAHNLYALAYISEWENRGNPSPSQVKIEEWAPQLNEELRPRLLSISAKYLHAIEAKWGKSVAEVFAVAGIITEESQAHALTDLFMGCDGHGVTIFDDFAESLCQAEEQLDIIIGSRSPLYWEGMDWTDLAGEAYDSGLRPD
jgi:hypothetical protein